MRPRILPAVFLLAVSASTAQACPTGELAISGNLDASSVAIGAGGIPVLGAATTYADLAAAAAFSTEVEVFDSLNGRHTITIYFYHTVGNNWVAHAVADGGEVAGGVGRGQPQAVGADIDLQFDSNAELAAGFGTAVLAVDWSNGAADAAIQFSLFGFTQYAGNSGISAINQDGGPMGCSQLGQVDFDGDGSDDLVVWQRSTGRWAVIKSGSGYVWKQWGLPGDYPLGGDYTGDGRADLVVWRPRNGMWYICRSDDDFDCGRGTAVQFGLPGDRPLKADYDGDRVLDFAVWRPRLRMFIYRRSATGDAVVQQWGVGDDIPLQPGVNR